MPLTMEHDRSGDWPGVRGDDMSKAMVASALIAALVGTGISTGAQARDKTKPLLPIAAVRVGLVNPKAPYIGPQLVRRGGYTPVNDMVRPRFVGGMVDIYPSSQNGFRFSTGTRYYSRPNFWIAAEQATRGLLYDPHWQRGGRGLARGFKRYTPAMTLGYDIQPMQGLVIGLEGGAISGRAIQPVGPGRGVSRDQRLGMDSRHGGMNEVATVSARLSF